MWNTRLSRLQTEADKRRSEDAQNGDVCAAVDGKPTHIPKEITQVAEIIGAFHKRRDFDPEDLRESISLHHLMPVQKSDLVSWLIRDSGSSDFTILHCVP